MQHGIEACSSCVRRHAVVLALQAMRPLCTRLEAEPHLRRRPAADLGPWQCPPQHELAPPCCTVPTSCNADGRRQACCRAVARAGGAAAAAAASRQRQQHQLAGAAQAIPAVRTCCWDALVPRRRAGEAATAAVRFVLACGGGCCIPDSPAHVRAANQGPPRCPGGRQPPRPGTP